MRLIDADKVDFGEVFIGASNFAKDTREAAQRLIDKQPTAYDVDKIVEKLEQEGENIFSTHFLEDGQEFMDNGIAEGFWRSAEIVKSGGVVYE